MIRPDREEESDESGQLVMMVCSVGYAVYEEAADGLHGLHEGKGWIMGGFVFTKEPESDTDSCIGAFKQGRDPSTI